VDTKHHFNEMEELSNKNDKLKEDLREDSDRNHNKIRLLERNIDSIQFKQCQGLAVIDSMKIDIDNIQIKQWQGLAVIDSMKIDIDNMQMKQEQGLELSRGIMNQLEKMEFVMRKE